MDPLFTSKWTGELATKDTIDRAMGVLNQKKKEWVQLPITEKLDILKEMRAQTYKYSVAAAKAAASVKYNADIGMEYVGGLNMTIRTIDAISRTLQDFNKTGKFLTPPIVHERNGQKIVQTLPNGTYDKYSEFYAAQGVKIELYIQPGKPATQGHPYLQPDEGRVSVLLGGGNQFFLMLLDSLHLLFQENTVVMAKHHPLQLPPAASLDLMLEPLKRRGYFYAINADVPMTQYLLYESKIDHVHMTGGLETHDMIVWGPQEGRAARKAANTPLLKVPMSSELGSVTPWLVVPGPWSDKEVKHHALALTEAVANNNSCNCLAAKVILVAAEWDKADLFIETTKLHLAKYPLQAAFYPGMTERYNKYRAAYPNASVYPSKPTAGAATCPTPPLPWVVNVLDKYPEDPKKEYALQNEPFAPCVTIIKMHTGARVGEGSPEMSSAFLKRAVKAANDDVWGTLSCTVLAHPKTQQAIGAELQQAYDELRFGSVCVNTWSVVGFMTPQGYWGAYAGDQTLKDAGTGIGAVRNSYMFDYPQKAVVMSPFIAPGVQLVPMYANPPPLMVLKIVMGFITGGWSGMYRTLTAVS